MADNDVSEWIDSKSNCLTPGSLPIQELYRLDYNNSSTKSLRHLEVHLIYTGRVNEFWIHNKDRIKAKSQSKDDNFKSIKQRRYRYLMLKKKVVLC